MPITVKKKKTKKIDDAVLKELISMIDEDRERDYRETAEFRDKQKVYLDQLMGKLAAQKSHRSWEAALSLPITWTESETIGTRIEQALTENNQLVVLLPTGGDDIERTQKIETWFNWFLRNYISGFFDTVDRSVTTTVRLGLTVLYSYYKREIKPILYKRQFKLTQEDTFDDITFSNKCFEIIDNIYGKILVNVESNDNFKYTVTYKRKTPVDSIQDVIEDTAELDCYFLEDSNTLEIEVEENSIEYDGVIFNKLSIDDCWFPATVKTNDELQSCNHVCLQFETDYSSVARLQAEKVYDLLTDEDLESLKNQTKTIDNESQIKQSVYENVGIQETEETDKSKGLVYYECFYKYDINQDGYDEDIIITYFPDQGKIARVRRLNEVFRHGKRPIDIPGFCLREESIFSIGVCEILNQIQEEMDILHNQFINHNTASTIPFGFARKDSAFGNNMERKEMELKPMTLFLVDDPNEVKFPYIPSNQNWAMTDLSYLRAQAQEAIGSNDAMLGRQQHSRTPVGSTLKLLAEANIRIKQGLKRFNRVFKDHLKKIYQLQRDYGPEKQTFRVMGEDGKFIFADISREDLKILPDFELGTSIDNLNKTFMRETMLLLVQTIVNPVLMQMGIMQPNNVYNLIEKLLWTYDIKDYQKIITKPIPNPVLSQKEENMRMMQGEYMDVNQLDDHVVHYQELIEFINSENFGLVDAEYIPLFQSHVKKHQMEIQKIEMQQQQMALQGQMQKQNMPKNNLTQQRPKINPQMPVGGQPSMQMAT